MTLSDDIKRVLELEKDVGYDSEDFSPCHEIRFYQASQDMASIIRQQQELLREAYEALEQASIHIGYLAAGAEQDKATVAATLSKIKTALGDV